MTVFSQSLIVIIVSDEQQHSKNTMPVAMVRYDSMALDDLKEISLRRSCEIRSSPSKWECQRIFSSAVTDLCESSSDHYSSDGCFDDEAELHSIIWTAGSEDALMLNDTENHDAAQIISPCSDEAVHLLPLCLWNQGDNLDLALHAHLEPQTPSAIASLNTDRAAQECAEIKSTSPRAVHGGKSESFESFPLLKCLCPDQICAQVSGEYLGQQHCIPNRHGPLYAMRGAS